MPTGSIIFDLYKDNRPRTYDGFYDIGPVQIPPLPDYVVLTDRADGSLWLLSFNPTFRATPDNLGHVSITNPPGVSGPRVKTYAAYEEPFIQANPQVRLIVRGANLGYEYLPQPTALVRADARVFAQKVGLPLEYREIIIPVGAIPFVNPPDDIGWRQYSNSAVVGQGIQP